MPSKALALMVAALLMAAPAAAEPSPKALPGAQMQIYATVVSVDRARATVVLKHAALETAGPGMRRCRLRDKKSLGWLKPGVAIEAVADTSRQMWLLDRVQPLHTRSDLPGRRALLKLAA